MGEFWGLIKLIQERRATPVQKSGQLLSNDRSRRTARTGNSGRQVCHYLAHHLPVVDVLEGPSGILEGIGRVE